MQSTRREHSRESRRFTAFTSVDFRDTLPTYVDAFSESSAVDGYADHLFVPRICLVRDHLVFAQSTAGGTQLMAASRQVIALAFISDFTA